MGSLQTCAVIIEWIQYQREETWRRATKNRYVRRNNFNVCADFVGALPEAGGMVTTSIANVIFKKNDSFKNTFNKTLFYRDLTGLIVVACRSGGSAHVYEFHFVYVYVNSRARKYSRQLRVPKQSSNIHQGNHHQLARLETALRAGAGAIKVALYNELLNLISTLTTRGARVTRTNLVFKIRAIALLFRAV